MNEYRANLAGNETCRYRYLRGIESEWRRYHLLQATALLVTSATVMPIICLSATQASQAQGFGLCFES